jgi:endo-1,4-beta-xylanase
MRLFPISRHSRSRFSPVPLFVVAILIVLWWGQVWGQIALSATTLRSLAADHQLYIGAAVAVQPLQSDESYLEVLTREFNAVVPENAMKFEVVHPHPDDYNFQPADAIVDLAKANGMKVRGHTLVWHHQLPDWVTAEPLTRDQAIEILHDHIETVVGHFRGQVADWDVVNEVLDEDGTLRETIWRKAIGPEYIAMAFRWAHAADPQAKLFYNNYGGEMQGPKADAAYALVKQLQQDGVPIDGAGFQMHVGLGRSPAPAAVAANMRRLNELGLEVQITEMDVQLQTGTGTEAQKWQAQAEIYRDMLQTCVEADNCHTFMMWGFTDRYSWIPGYTGNPDSPLIFDRDYQPKPAFDRLMEVLSTPSK